MNMIHSSSRCFIANSSEIAADIPEAPARSLPLAARTSPETIRRSSVAPTINLNNQEEGPLLSAASSNFAEKFNTLRNLDDQGLSSDNSPPHKLPNNYQTYLHTTSQENIAPIYQHGLIAGGTEETHNGIGDIAGRPCTDGIYVVMPGQHICDARSETVVILARTPPFPDLNYKRDVAGVFTEKLIRPIREAVVKHEPTSFAPPTSPPSPTTPPQQSNAFSFVVEKITPKTQAGIAASLNLSPNSATKAVLNNFKNNYPSIRTQFLQPPSLTASPANSHEGDEKIFGSSCESSPQPEGNLLWNMDSLSPIKKS